MRPRLYDHWLAQTTSGAGNFMLRAAVTCASDQTASTELVDLVELDPRCGSPEQFGTEVKYHSGATTEPVPPWM
ncbi:MAG: hypothetical protein AB7G28_22170 [Pirellulales bacterium]